MTTESSGKRSADLLVRLTAERYAKPLSFGFAAIAPVKVVKSQQLVFVVQKHQATSLHYDLRLEIGAVMPSWSIPKGPSLDSSVRRLALPTSDHPMEYRHFEGVIPAGGYGAGPVMIWDEGTYNPEVETGKGTRKEITDRGEAEQVARKSLEDGNLKFALYGSKLRGSFALVRTAGLGGKVAWLLIKHRDEYSKEGYDAKDYDFSSVSGRSLEQIAAEEAPGSPPQGKNPEPEVSAPNT